MAQRSKWFLVSAALIGCSQGITPEETESKSDEVQRVSVSDGVSVSDCDCHAKNPPAAPRTEAVDLSQIDLTRSPAKGPDDAAATLVVFCDWECGYCRKTKQTLTELERTYGASLRIVFKQHPLPFHANARLAARASLVAHDQGKFWEFQAALYGSDAVPDRARLERIAAKIGLEPRAFMAAADSEELDARLAKEVEDAAKVGVRGTPTFVLNGKKLVGAYPVETFEALIDEALGTTL